MERNCNFCLVKKNGGQHYHFVLLNPVISKYCWQDQKSTPCSAYFKLQIPMQRATTITAHGNKWEKENASY